VSRMEKRNLTRRTFGRMTAGIGAGLSVGPALNVMGANEKIALGLIGCSGRGMKVMRTFQRNGAEFRAVCDVDRKRLEEGRARAENNADTYKDYRNLLERKDIEAVLIATPPHWHALPFVDACKAGLDIYCEKPLGVTIWEGQQMCKAARKYERVTQCGTQQHSGPHYREAVRLIHEGHIGKINKVLCWNWANTNEVGMGKAEPTEPPDHLDWDFWLGPVPKRPYFPQRCHGGFRNFWDTDGGVLTDWGTHHLDIIHWALKQDYPRSVCSEGGKFVVDDCRETPDTQDVVYQYDNCLVQFSLRSGNAHDPCHPHKVPDTWSGYGIEFYGKKGTLFINRNRYEIWPEAGEFGEGVEHYEYMNTEKEREMDDNHVGEFLENIKTRRRCICDVEVCHRASSACHLGNIALRSGERIVWDGERERITNHRKLNSWLKRPYRRPWKLKV